MMPRHFLPVILCVGAMSVAAGGARAHGPSDSPSGATAQAPQTAGKSAAILQPLRMRGAAFGASPVLDAAPSFAPALRLRAYLPPSAERQSDEAPIVAALARPETGGLAPMGEVRSLTAPEPPSAEAPVPPVRPPDLASLSPLTDAPLPPARPGDLADRPVVLASLAPAAPETELRPPLAETAPLPAPHPEVAEKPAADAPFAKGQPAYVRIFKKEGQLELWLKRGERFALYKTWPICKWSGHLGPKMREGDYQSPEGFYSVSAKQLHPKSNYHLAFNVGFPNALDKQLGYTGGLVMVHGDCQSVGCFAMTNRGIDEIYGYVAAALAHGQKEVPVHIFPFRMTDANLAAETGTGLLAFASYSGNEQYASFWRNLKEGYDLFEKTGEPPTAYACRGRYAFNASSSCKRIAGW